MNNYNENYKTIVNSFRTLIMENSVLDDVQKEMASNIRKSIQQYPLEFGAVTGDPNGGYKWEGTFDNDIKWTVDTGSDSKIFISMDSKPINIDKITALRQLVVFLETDFISSITQL